MKQFLFRSEKGADKMPCKNYVTFFDSGVVAVERIFLCETVPKGAVFIRNFKGVKVAFESMLFTKKSALTIAELISKEFY